MEKRTREAKEFFIEETEDEESRMEASSAIIEETEDKDTEIMEKSNEPETNQTADSTTVLSPEKTNEPAASDFECITDIIEDCANDDQISDEIQFKSAATDVIEIHTARTELDDELDAMSTNEINKEKKKLSISTDYVPKLKGDKGLMIDFETNDLLPDPKTGVDELLTRFVKNALVKPQPVETQDIKCVFAVKF